MDRKTIQDATFPKCPIRNILARIGDKWAMLVLYTLEQHGTLRFNDMYRCIPDVSQKMLTTTLKTLTEDGLVARKLYPAVPPKVEYSLTERGRSLLPHLDSLISWAIENFDAIISNRSNSKQLFCVLKSVILSPKHLLKKCSYIYGKNCRVQGYEKWNVRLRPL